MRLETARLETLSGLYDIPLWTLRKWASARKFPGIIRKKKSRRIYVDLAIFDKWFRDSESQNIGSSLNE